MGYGFHGNWLWILMRREECQKFVIWLKSSSHLAGGGHFLEGLLLES
jgi:hypothetical protein